jgi:putative membrane protein
MRLRVTLLVVFLAIAAASGIAPVDRATWVLENALIVAFVTVLLPVRRTFPLTTISAWLVFAFCVLHELGAHYTYSLEPFDRWTQDLFGRSIGDALGLQRNHYDWLVHFAFGLLLSLPMRELFLRVAHAHGFASYWLPVQMTLSFSAL